MGTPSAGVTVAEVDAAAAAAVAAHVANASDPHAAAGYVESVPAQYSFPVAATDIGQSVAFPFDGAQVLRIQITPKGAAATTGTIAVKNGISSGGNTMLSTASVNLSTLTANTPTALTLTGTAADLQGDLGDYLEIVVDNSDAEHEVMVTFGRA